MPSRWFAPCGRQSRAPFWPMAVVVGWCALLMPVVASAQETEAPSTIRLRVHWDSGGDPVIWSGKASIDHGRLLDVQPWGRDPDSAALAMSRANGVVIAPRLPRRIAAFDVTAEADGAAVLRVELRAGDGEPVVADMLLSDITTRAKRVALGDGVLQVYRAPDDRIRVQTDRQQLIFAPGDVFRFGVEATVPGATPHSPVDLVAELQRGRSGGALPGGGSQRLAIPQSGPLQASFEVQLPEQEGVYTIRLSAQKPSGLIQGWASGGRKPLAGRSFQVVVWDAGRVTRLGDDGRQVVSIDPTHSQWWRLMPEWKWTRRVPWLPKGPLGSGPAEKVDFDGGRLIHLAPATHAQTVAWQAYPLPIESPGTPHVLEIDVPDDASQELSLTLFDRDATGQAASLGDSLTAVSGGRHAGPMKTIRKLFWPKTDSPMLVISNHSQQHGARYGGIRVRAIQQQTLDTASEELIESRLVAACVSTPLLVQAMQATQDPSRYVHEDWLSCYQAATRLASYMELAGFNGAVLTVANAQGALYPSEVLGNHTGLDRERLATGVSDLPRKDMLEVLLREFDRRGLRLVVALQLESVMPTLEQSQFDGQGVGIECRDATGRTVGEGAVRYNPTHPLVRGELLRAVAEVAEKAAGHRSFAGVSLDLTPRSHLALLDDVACVDPATLDAFLADSNLTWPAGVNRNAGNVQRALLGNWNAAWRQWRIGQMTSLYSKMARVVHESKPGARLLINTHRLFDDYQGRETIRPRLEKEVSLDALLASRGVDRSQLAVAPNLTLVTPLLDESPSTLADAACLMQVSELHWGEGTHEPPVVRLTGDARRADLPGFKSRSPFGAGRTVTTTTLGRKSVGVGGMRGLSRAAALAPAADLLEGGPALPLSLDSQRIAMRGLLGKLPAASEVARSESRQPLVLSTFTTDKQSYLLAANLSPWPLQATVTLDTPEACRATRLDDAGDAAQLGVGKHAVPLDLPPHDVYVYRLDCPRVTTLGVRTQEQPEAAKSLAEEVAVLGRRDLSAKRSFEKCRNLSFEQLDSEGLPVGWRELPQQQGHAAANRQSPADGQVAVQVTAGAETVRLSSDAFSPPATRQLVMAFHVRPEHVAEDGSLTIRFASAGRHDAYTTIPASALGEAGAWRQFVFAEELPVKAEGPMRIEFEAQNVSVSIDRLELHSLAFPLNFLLRAESARQRLELLETVQSAKMALSEGRTTDCLDLLDGYWARFLTEFTPEAKPKPQVAEAKPEPKEEEDKAPAVSNGWKNYLPRFWR